MQFFRGDPTQTISLSYIPPRDTEDIFVNEPKKRRGIGPAIFVTAAFIGPGTVMTASKAGATFGYTLLWAILFSVVAAIVLQEMAARLGIVTGKGLTEAIRSTVQNRTLRFMLLGLVLLGILFGNSAYQTGNILGAASGLEILSSGNGETNDSFLGSITMWSIVIATCAIAVIWIGRFDFLQVLLVFLVATMGLLFLLAAIALGPNWQQLFTGFIPTFPQGDPSSSGLNEIWLVIGLIGTTVVPYNLFLHASSAAARWPNRDETARSVRQSLWDTIISVSLGGVITASLLVTAAIAFGDGTQLKKVADIASQLRPLLGNWAEFGFGVGILAAGLTSSITAPIAAGFATAGCFGKDASLSSPFLKWVATAVVLAGLGCAILFGSSPSEAIIVAQIANGLLLPIIAIFLLVIVNRSQLMEKMVNGWLANLLGISIVILTALIAARQFDMVIGKLKALVGF